MLPVAFVAAALLAMLVVAPAASAAPSPIKSGTTTLTINKGLTKKAKKAGIKITAVKPTKIKGTKATFAVTGGEIDLSSGAGTVNHSGGLKIAWGKKSVTLKSLSISTTGAILSAKMGGKTIKLATLAGVTSSKLGFGTSIAAKKLKLTAAAAKSLNSKLTPVPTKTKVKKKGKTVTKVVKVQPPFKANLVLGSSVTEIEPETVGVLAKESLVYSGDSTLLGKLADVGVKIETISPTTAAGNVFSSAISGGTISPLGTSGAVTSAGGLKLVQKLEGGPSTTITLGSIGVDLAAKTATVEVIGESNAETEGKKPLNVGNLGRSSIADLTITSNTPSPATSSVTINASAKVQAVAAEVLEGFVKVYQGYYAEVVKLTILGELKAKGEPITPAIEEAAKKQGIEAAAKKVANDNITAGESLGTFAFTAIGE
jgi:hypothetical protein